VESSSTGPEPSRPGSLTIVGTGIRTSLQTTPEARSAIEHADKVLFLLDVVGEQWIASLNPTAESLGHLYSADRPRAETYRAMVDAILSALRPGLDVCVTFYGHPGVYVTPSHEALRRARSEGFIARLLPGVSAEDSLFADLGVDPGEWGWHSYEATDFLLFRRVADPSVPLVLWQLGAVGERRARAGPNREALRILSHRLREQYGSDHEVIMYEASPYPIGSPLIDRVCLEDLPTAAVRPMATLYVPPALVPTPDPEIAAMLEIPASSW